MVINSFHNYFVHGTCNLMSNPKHEALIDLLTYDNKKYKPKDLEHFHKLMLQLKNILNKNA